MTVSSSTNRVSYSGNGTLTTFAYTFKVFDQGDLTVILRSSTGTETVQTITTHYTVTGVGDVGGGNVVFVTAPSATETVVILREQDLTQGLDLVPNDPFPAQSLEESLDKLTFMVQQHEEELGRAIKASRTNTLTGSEFTISAADRANKVFSFDSSGDLSVTQELGTFKGDWAASTAYVERDLVKDTTTNNVFIVTSAHTSSGSLPLTTNTNSDKYEKIIDITNPPGDVTFGGSITTSSSVTAGSFVIGSADINENDLEAIDEVIAGTVAASKAVVVDVNKDISSFRNLTATGDITFGGLSDGTITVTAFVDEDNMASDSATLVPTQQSVKAYVDAQVATADTLTEILGNGNTTSGANIQMTTTDELQFRDTALKISSSVDGQLDIDADTEIEITAPTVDIDASTEVNISGATKIGGTLNIDTIDELTTDAGTTINSTFIGNNKIGIGTSVVGDTQVAIRGSAAKLRLESTSVGNHNWDVGVFTTSFRIYHQATGQNPLWIDSTDNVGIGTTSPSTKLDVTGTVTADGLTVETSGDPAALIRNTGTGAVSLTLRRSANDDAYTDWTFDNTSGNLSIISDDTTRPNATRIKMTYDGDISFYEDTGTTAKFFWDASAEYLGIRTTSPVSTLHVSGGSATRADIQITTSATGETAGDGFQIGYIDSLGAFNWNYENSDWYVGTNNNRRLTINGSGQVGIGTSSPSSYHANADNLVIEDSGNAGITIATTDSAYFSQINFADGTSGAQAYTGILRYAHSDNSLRIIVNTGEKMRIDSSGNVGIGTTSPFYPLSVRNTAFATVAEFRTIDGTNNPGLEIKTSASGTTLAQVYSSGASANLILETNNTERMRIDSSGNLLVGTTSIPDGTNKGMAWANTGDESLKIGTSSTVGDYQIRFYNGNGNVGNIITSGSATSYNTSSDHRLKENVVDLTGATARIKQLAPKRFNFIADANTTVDGFLAHEVQTVVPEAITGTHNEVDADGNPVYQGIDQSKLVPLLVATIKELEARITALENA